MKNKIFMYLFIFTLLIVVFQYVNAKNILDDSAKRVVTLKAQNAKYKDSLSNMQQQASDLSLFNLEDNQDAIDYFYKDGIDTDNLIPLIKNELYALNEADGDHPLIPYAAEEGKKMQFSNIRLLNHKWIIADFSDGAFWGEVLIKYEVTDKKELNFKLVEQLMYPL